MTREKIEKAKKRFQQIQNEYYITIPVLSTMLKMCKHNYYSWVPFLENLISQNKLEKKHN